MCRDPCAGMIKVIVVVVIMMVTIILKYHSFSACCTLATIYILNLMWIALSLFYIWKTRPQRGKVTCLKSHSWYMSPSKPANPKGWALFVTPCHNTWDPSSHHWPPTRCSDCFPSLTHCLLFPLDFFITFALSAVSAFGWPCAAHLGKSHHSFLGQFLHIWLIWKRSLCPLELFTNCLLFILKETNFFL